MKGRDKRRRNKERKQRAGGSFIAQCVQTAERESRMVSAIPVPDVFDRQCLVVGERITGGMCGIGQQVHPGSCSGCENRRAA